jgi:hypothetical protein
MQSPDDAEVEAAARSDCAFDKVDYDGLGRLAKQRYRDRSRAALTAAAQVRAGKERVAMIGNGEAI